jgi:type I restriction enzyme S subunit
MAGEVFERTTFGELISQGALEIGDGYRAKNQELGGNGLIFLRAGHVTDTHIDFAGVERFHAELEPRVRSKLAKPGDAVVTTKGNSTGRTTFVTASMPQFVYSPHLSYWRSHDPGRIEGGFLRYWSKGPEFTSQLAGMKASTDMAPYLSLVDQKRLGISLPPIQDQRAIAHILGTLDDKIELNRRMNETLETMARALFKSWFVDFDPVRAKTEGRDPSLPKPLANLFPARLVDSELGEIPEGWRAQPLGHWVDTLSGGTPSKSERTYWAGTVPWISPKVMTAIHADEAEAYVNESAIGNGTRLAPALSTLVMVRGMGLHESVRVSQARREVTFNQDVKALVGVSIEPTLLLFALLDAQPILLEQVESSGHGTGKLPSEVLLALPIAMPDRDTQRRLSASLRVLNDRIASTRAACRTLADLRDTLLPKLISGELRLKNLERFVEVAA